MNSLRPRRRVLKNAAMEAEQFRRRAALAFMGVVLALAGLSLWYFRLQVWQHSEYATRSEENRIKLRPVVPARGLIYDRKGRILADNVPAFRLDVTPKEAGPVEDWLPQLQRIVALTPEDIANYQASRHVARGFKPVTLKLRVTEEEAARFAVDRWRFPGIELQSYLNRRYLHGELTSHVIGYVGRIDAADMKTLSGGETALSHIGKTGLERYYEKALRGQVGFEKIVTNVDGRPMYSAGRDPAKPGADLRLSIDLDLQQAMVTAFGDKDGSAVAVDPRTGEILAMVSLPAYDANLFVNGISHTHYKALTTNPSRPLFNRNVLGGGPPGSTVKPLIGLAGLDSGLRTPEYKVFSTGTFYLPGTGRGWRDAHGGAGWTDLRKSISQSVNFYYYKLAYEMGIEKFDQYMYRYGFGQKSGIDLLGENVGVVPSPEWKAKRSKERWYPGETVNAGIGQGYWVATALQLARGTAAIANGGELRRLHLAAARRDGYDKPWAPLQQPVPERITDNAGHLRAVQEGMIATIHGGGTATAMARGAPYMMAGKTGTAQKISRKGSQSFDPHSLPYHLRHEALFVGYAPAENPTIAIAVVVEHGGFGGTAAAPIARKVFDAWLLGTMPEADENLTRSPQGGASLIPVEEPPEGTAAGHQTGPSTTAVAPGTRATGTPAAAAKVGANTGANATVPSPVVRPPLPGAAAGRNDTAPRPATTTEPVR
ncbi:penicillin-binding protein 2 [Agrilutibacter solisilvae]|uniref:Peptidoglycan D,D-transpeptidase MrdA n=1 Tax=Agrilutibacter solisilvae TaxID=2763317 RepID=A0A974Y5I3_9GAMM|nr:penicillin-binding protein 2 [Lysobacter solisilvae]